MVKQKGEDISKNDTVFEKSISRKDYFTRKINVLQINEHILLLLGILAIFQLLFHPYMLNIE